MSEDSKLSFAEFRSLMRSLREPRGLRDMAVLVFALFDLDGNHYISRSEFQESQFYAIFEAFCMLFGRFRSFSGRFRGVFRSSTASCWAARPRRTS